MQDPAHVLVPWSSFYVITGSAAAALTGLVFVVITLVMGARLRVTGEGLSAFTTPTIVHFASVLFVSLAMSAPWGSLAPLIVLVAALGAAGLGYVATVAALTRRQTAYEPGVDDWTWFVAVPAAGYAAILAGGLALPSGVAPFAVAGGTTLLVFLGIRNAWDVVTYLTLEHGPDDGG